MGRKRSTDGALQTGRVEHVIAGFAAAGAALGMAALVNSGASRRAEARNPPTGRFINLDGVCIHYQERGAGSPALLLHGNGASSDDLLASGLVDRLSGGMRVIAPDRPGYGHSARPRGTTWSPEAQADLMLRFLDRLGCERPVVVGHSWGALVALAMALAAPGRLHALVLLSGYYYPTPRLDVPLLSGPALPVGGSLMAHTASPLLARAILPLLLRRIFEPQPVDRRFRAGFPLEMALRPSQIRASGEETASMIPAARRLSRRYAELELPVVIMAGEGDRIVDPERHSVRLHHEIPSSALAMVPGAGHMIHYAAADAIAAAAEALAVA